MQRLVRPEVAEHGQIARLRVLAGGGGIGDADGDRRVLGQPPALRRLIQKPASHSKNRLSRQQAPQEQITVLSQPGPQNFPNVQVVGRIPERFKLKHDFPLAPCCA
jgi:hypothetical protein